MFRRILIANRGEIALRIIRACRELNIETACVFSEEDRGAEYLRLADCRSKAYTKHNDLEKSQLGRMVRSIEGRKDDMIKLKSGKMIGRIDHIFKGLEGIVEAQIVQQTIDDILIRLVVDRSFDKSTLKKVETNARERFGNEVGLATKIVREIPRTPNGKFKTVVSLVD